jgi:hypothetical protein
MSDFAFHTASHTCRCTQCMLIRCGALEADWPAWRDVEFAGDVRVAMSRLTRREPAIWPQPGQWAGERAWFDLLGIGLEFGGSADGTRR